MHFDSIATHELATISGGQFPINNQIPTLIGPPAPPPTNPPSPSAHSASEGFSAAASAVYGWVHRHLFGR